MGFKYLIVDDEPLARKLILSHTSRIEGLELAGECSSAIDAFNFLRSHPVNLIFLDIRMPELDGLDFLAALKQPPAVIITTAFREFGPEAFGLDVIDYLLKPISFERVLKAVNKFFDQQLKNGLHVVNTADEQPFIYVRADRKMHKIPLEKILYVESLDEYVKVYLTDKLVITRETITTFHDKLPQDRFVRVHRSFIVSSKAIATVSAEGVEIGGKIIPFGRAYKHNALATLRIKI